MISLTIICILYSTIGLAYHKKKYGTYVILNDNSQFWAIMLLFTISFSIIMIIILIIKYLP